MRNPLSPATWPPRSPRWAFSQGLPGDAGPPDAQLGGPAKYGNKQARMTIYLANMVGFPYGSECHPHVCRGRSGGQPLGGGDPSRNPACNTEPPNAGPGAATQGATAGALGARYKIDRRWGKAVRARQPRDRGAAGGRASRGERSGPPEGAPAPVVAPDILPLVGSAARLPPPLPRHTSF